MATYKRGGKATPYGQTNFAASVKAWSDLTLVALENIFRESAQRVIEKMQEVGPSKARGGGGTGHMPVDLGFLRASLIATLNNPASGLTTPPSRTGTYAYDEGQVSLIILAAQLGDSIFAVYTAAYARRMEYGFTGTDSLGREYNHEGYGFVRLAAQQWETIVQDVVKEARSRV
jgi:hypothetical protein